MSKYNIKTQLEIIKKSYSKIKIEGRNISSKTIENSLLSAIAMFSLKFPSLLQFDQSQEEEIIRYNLKTLYGVKKAPSDTYMREILDEVSPNEVRVGFKNLFRLLQTGKQLEKFQYLNGHYLVSIDGTQHFNSNKVHCDNCCEKHHRNGTITYHHNLLGAAIVNPKMKAVIPLCPEPILKRDGSSKNDCEQNAVDRLTLHLRREHPHLKMIIVEDALYSKAPHIRKLNKLNLKYIIGVKSSDHQYLFKTINQSNQVQSFELEDDQEMLHKYRFINDVSLNQSNLDLKVNFLEYIQIKKNGNALYFSWVTDIQIKQDNCKQLMLAGRARWKIENETFNTLKNQGYQLEHNFGHGRKNLSTIFSFLLILAFLIDQIQIIASITFINALIKAKSKVRLWFKMRGLFSHFFINDWNDLFLSIAHQPKANILIPDTS